MERYEERLSSRFSPDFIDQMREKAGQKINITAELLMEWKASEWEFAEEGGIFAALWNLSGAYEQGISFSLEKIPVHQEIIEICEIFDLNPYRLWSGECVLAAADHGADLAAEMEGRGILAAVIGKVETGITRKVISAGGMSYLERPQPDEIEKLRSGR